uniref:Solute carrier family 22 member 6 n=1 Tax=Calidris pygmaea TaxID=425635 RepID=A0A8C3K2Q0_9CHAR
MNFVELLARLGGMGRFQVTYVAALAIPLLMLASHNLLQNFTAGVPEHHCQPRPVANDSAGDVPLLVSIPSDGHHRLQRCRRYVEPQWHLLEVNGTVNGTTNGAPTEPCHDGWTYQDGIFAHTIVTEWDLVCESKKLRQVAQSIYMAGILLGSGLFGVLSDKYVPPRSCTGMNWEELGGGRREGYAQGCPPLLLALGMEWIPTEARAVVGTINGYCYTLGQFVLAAAAFGLPHWRWLQLVVHGGSGDPPWTPDSPPPDLALKGLRKVARVNGRKEEGDKLSEEVLEGLGAKSHLCGPHLVTSGGFHLDMLDFGGRFSTSFAYYGLAMDLQGFGVDIYLSQLVFGAVDIPAKLASVLAISCVGRRVAQAGSLALAGICILANIIVPMELQILRMAFAVIGKGSLAASFNCAYIFTGELLPTIIRWAVVTSRSCPLSICPPLHPLIHLPSCLPPINSTIHHPLTSPSIHPSIINPSNPQPIHPTTSPSIHHQPFQPSSHPTTSPPNHPSIMNPSNHLSIHHHQTLQPSCHPSIQPSIPSLLLAQADGDGPGGHHGPCGWHGGPAGAHGS